jgi:hypothetical protein
MSDNFNLSKFLRKNPLLNENIGGYVDLKPINELGGDTPFGMPDTSEENSWMGEVDGTENYSIGEWKCYYDYPGVLAWSYGDTPFDELAVYATPNFDTDNQTPIQIDVNGDSVENMMVPKGVFADFNEYAEAMSPYLDKIESKYVNASIAEADDSFIAAQRDAVGAKGSSTYGVDNENDVVTIELDMAWDADDNDAAQAAFDQYGIEVSEIDGNPGTFEVTGRKEDVLAYLKSEFYEMDDQDIATYYPELLEGELEELEKPKSIYVTDDSEDEKGFIVPSDDDTIDTNRMMELGGEEIEKGIMFLLDDGFDPEDVLEMCKMFIEGHVEAAEKGNKFESQINEYESSYELINGKCYRVDDEGNRTAASMSKCR